MKMHACNICANACELFLSLNDVPQMQNIFCVAQQRAIDFPLVNAALFFCSNCNHVSIVKDKSSEFDIDYNNDQTASSVAVNHIDRVIAEIETEVSERGARIVEIGCGRGELLSRLRRRDYLNVAGYDPIAPDTVEGLILKQIWDSRAGSADVFILRHVLEAVPEIDEFVRQLAAALNSSGAVYCEFTNVERIAHDSDVFSLYPEYFNMFSVSSLVRLFQRHGLSVTKTSSYFGGEWIGVWARKLPLSMHHIDVAEFQAQLAQRIRKLPQPVALWGIGGQGGNFLSFGMADRSLVSLVVDISKRKQGLFVPPYGQQVMSPEVLQSVQPGTILAANKRYLDEIVAMAPGWSVVTIDELVSSTAPDPSNDRAERKQG